MKAIHKYKHSNKLEHKRRIAQSFGYRFTIWDMPHMMALMERAGIYLDKPILKDTDTISV
jgi:hypothetical protein